MENKINNMKYLFVYVAIVTATLVSLMGCTREYISFEEQNEYQTSPSPVSNITTEALPGQIMLRWDVPEDKNYYFLRISYYDPLQKKNISTLVSNYVSELLINGTRARFGEYEFKFQTFNSKNEGSDLQAIHAVSGKAPVTETIAAETAISLTAEQLSFNVPPVEGSAADLVDASPATLVNTPWSGDAMKQAPFWLQVDLKEPIQNFRIAYSMPSSKGTGPKIVTVKISEDGDTWEDLTKITSGLVTAKGTSWKSDVLRAEAPFKYLRWVVDESTSGGKYAWNMGDFSLSTIEFATYDPETVPLN